MKRTPSPQIISHGQIKNQNSNSRNGHLSMGKKDQQKTHQPFKSIKAAVKKVVGVFTIFFIWQKKPNKHGPVGEIACKYFFFPSIFCSVTMLLFMKYEAKSVVFGLGLLCLGLIWVFVISFRNMDTHLMKLSND